MVQTKTTKSLGKLLAPHAGKWVTLSKDEKTVLGVSNDMDVAIKQAKEKGEDFPLLIKAPDESTTAFFF